VCPQRFSLLKVVTWIYDPLVPPYCTSMVWYHVRLITVRTIPLSLHAVLHVPSLLWLHRINTKLFLNSEISHYELLHRLQKNCILCTVYTQRHLRR
jgi:hypothetical protein